MTNAEMENLALEEEHDDIDGDDTQWVYYHVCRRYVQTGLGAVSWRWYESLTIVMLHSTECEGKR